MQTNTANSGIIRQTIISRKIFKLKKKFLDNKTDKKIVPTKKITGKINPAGKSLTAQIKLFFVCLKLHKSPNAIKAKNIFAIATDKLKKSTKPHK